MEGMQIFILEQLIPFLTVLVIFQPYFLVLSQLLNLV
jgi:hypothetical protein